MPNKKTTPIRFTWVYMGERGPRIRWVPVGILAVGCLLGYLLAQTILHLTLQAPFRFGIVSATFAVHVAFFATLIEVQRQNLNKSKFVFRFNITYLFVITLLAAIFFGSITAEIRASQKGFQQNLAIKAELEKLIGGGSVYLGEQGGKRITCQITRSDFSDRDLEDLIIASRGIDSADSEITMLVLEATAVTDKGLQALPVCKKLEFLALPPIPLSDQTIESLASCRKLKFLSGDQKKLTASQLNQLYERLPDTKINGVSYREMQAANRK